MVTLWPVGLQPWQHTRKRRSLQRMELLAESILKLDESVDVATRCRLNTVWFDWFPGILSAVRLLWTEHFVWLTDQRLVLRRVFLPRGIRVFPRPALIVVKFDPRMGAAEMHLRAGAESIQLDFDMPWFAEAEGLHRLILADQAAKKRSD